MWFRKEKEIKIHLYALCWNEERMLPFFFRHYDSIVDRYFISDNNSTDRSLDLLSKNQKVTLGHFEVTGDSFVDAALTHYNESWKESRGMADWVIVCNIDEHVFHSDLRSYLKQCLKARISLIIPAGYNMTSDEFPDEHQPLAETVRYGARDRRWDKPQIFNPNKIREINFAPGRHTARPIGKVRTGPEGVVKLLHYKYLGLDYVCERHSELRSGLRARDIANKWGEQYLRDYQGNAEEYQSLRANSILVSTEQ